MLYTKAKRIFDFVFSLTAIIILSPFFVLIPVAIKFTSKGHIIFKQKRVGQKQKLFTFYKFRTMGKNAENLKRKYSRLNQVQGPAFKIENDPRFTKIGKFLSRTNLDELPQFFNVLKGDMSVVGFRPPTPDEVKCYKEWQIKRFDGIPGMTSLWAVSGGHTIKFDDWIKMDIDYNKIFSFSTDLQIIAKTGFNFLKKIVSSTKMLK